MDFDAELQKYPAAMERAETLATDPMLLYFTSGDRHAQDGVA